MTNITYAERGLLGWQNLTALGGFERALWTALGVADTENLNALAKGFPEEAEALRRYRNEAGYWEDVRERAML